MAQTLTLRRPDDWHLHLRDGDMLRAVLPWSARAFGRAIVMPNLDPPVTTSSQAAAYRDRIRSALPSETRFEPLMTCYLTDRTDPDDIARGHSEQVFTAAKLYPAGATTNSSHGVTAIANIRPVLARMERIGMPLLVHGEVTDPEVDIFDREAVFLERVLTPLRRDFPALKIVLEHVTTADGVAFVEEGSPGIAGTITPQHLILNRNALFAGGLRPHAYCLPVVKRERHRLALRRAATSGSDRFFLGTDSAPHAVDRKESSCGCAGIFNAPHALEAYASVFEAEDALDRLEAFASEHGPRFYGLPLNEDTITLERSDECVPEKIGDVVPFGAGESFGWKLAV
jgi:dihydroorotase